MGLWDYKWTMFQLFLVVTQIAVIVWYHTTRGTIAYLNIAAAVLIGGIAVWQYTLDTRRIALEKEIEIRRAGITSLQAQSKR